MDKEVKIIPPEGYEVDKEHSTFECIKFKPIKPLLPTTWEEFCETYQLTDKECWINSVGYVEVEVGSGKKRNSKTDRNLLPSLEYAKAMLALCQLIQLRDCYNDGWRPDWTDGNEYKYTIYFTYGKIVVGIHNVTSYMLSFKTKELRDTFTTNFKDLIEIAKPLL